ncbi:hypothetical protein [Couchioplanes azureus]|uniref:hypothetical protein n=1 Tax=Couchioplanes caeruleus TaxID=56438 RepID=UPI00166F819A|nr:hypothetical protein [Couchioplanes caeruleus]GGQ77151.1 hypothetical protein GCM10010166_53870 [Couchioplanes caeruleus subsp. azureus]
MTSAGAPGVGRAVRWLLLFCTVFGLATMHTLGHADPHVDSHDPAVAMAVTGPAMGSGAFPAAVAEMVGAPGGHCPEGHCGGGPGHGGMSGWAVCLAVLGGFGVVMLLAALLLFAAGGAVGAGRRRLSVLGGPRPPPRRRWGLTVASVAVLRI